MQYRSLLCAFVLLACAHARADEGMWTFDNFPSQAVKDKYGVDITPEWLDHVRLSTGRLAYCTTSFVSPDGLMLTNYHCVARCVAEHSSRDSSLVETGFIADRREKEKRCGTQVVDVLTAIEDVTAAVRAGTQNIGDTAANETRKQTLTKLEQGCEAAAAKSKAPVRCQAVTLYEGGQYLLYKYKRYDDVRLVFSPEAAIATFGGDPDNFQFPRWCLDMGLLRVYENGKPARTPNYLQIDFEGPAAGEAVFVVGNPMSTQRLLTLSQLKAIRQTELPPTLVRLSELRGRYLQFAAAGSDEDRVVRVPMMAIENRLKIGRKLLDVLLDDELIAAKTSEEQQLRSVVAKNGNLQRGSDDPWEKIARAQAANQRISPAYSLLESAAGFESRLFRYARLLTRAAEERGKPNEQRLHDYSDTALPRIEQEVRANVPVYAELEQINLATWLARIQEWLGPDHPVVQRLLAKDSPESLAESLVAGSRLGEPSARVALWEGGISAVTGSSDAMMLLVRDLEADARTIRKRYEDDVEAPVGAGSEAIARARFATLGTRVYPDATFTLRINFGAVQGWNESGAAVEPFTRLSRMFERATGQVPFVVPPSWLAVKDQLDMNTPFNLSSSNDIVSGNSGSPLIDAHGRIVGLIFDGNIHSIGNVYHFDPEHSRAVAVHPALIKEALTKVYRVPSLLTELGIRR